MTISQPFLLDCTRIVAHRWSDRTPTGIDRVCEAYRTHFAPRAQAVVQLRGRARMLTCSQSDSLFAMLENPRTGFRRRFAGLAATIGAGGRKAVDADGAIYLNVSHTDFDLDRHLGWVRQSRVKPVYLVHDLIPIEHPQWTTPHKARRHAGRVRSALQAAYGIITNSHATARALGAFADAQGMIPPPILSAPLGAPELPIPDRFEQKRPAHFVCVSTIEQRKNHILLLDVWQRLIARRGDAAPRLVLIGRWGIGSYDVRRRLLADPQLRRFVSVLSDCADAEVARHLRSATALLAPSQAEGFGLTVVEAMRIGVPVIASDLPVFRETGGDIPTYLDPTAPDAWLTQICEFSGDGRERQRQLVALKDYRAPEWCDHFTLVENWLEGLPATASCAGLPLPSNDRLAASPVRPALAGTLQ